MAPGEKRKGTGTPGPSSKRQATAIPGHLGGASAGNSEPPSLTHSLTGSPAEQELPVPPSPGTKLPREWKDNTYTYERHNCKVTKDSFGEDKPLSMEVVSCNGKLPVDSPEAYPSRLKLDADPNGVIEGTQGRDESWINKDVTLHFRQNWRAVNPVKFFHFHRIFLGHEDFEE